MASTSCFLYHSAPSTAAAAKTPSRRTAAAAAAATVRPTQMACRAQNQAGSDDEVDGGAAVSRRLAMTALVGAAAVGIKVSPADAAYGQAANVFGKPKTNTDFLPYDGSGFKVLIPSKWNPSKEVEYPGQVLRYEDNFDPNSYVAVMITPTTKKTITDYGPPEQFLSQVDYLLGKQAYAGKTDAEGGFGSDEVAVANIIESSTPWWMVNNTTTSQCLRGLPTVTKAVSIISSRPPSPTVSSTSARRKLVTRDGSRGRRSSSRARPIPSKLPKKERVWYEGLCILL
uniref:23 kDa subunit of oxygen evolving system of photosystem II n=1 Tax=Ananas comosus var. bracteatus TaxID=296719 RepID=A0A6V7PC75_ANACO|nr:unnamed protein product [Ananas comosus var. bracteatus]